MAVGGAVWGVTGAFYNDSETSAGNIFTAGSIDLKVDHTKQTYNGVDCKTCDVTIQSDTTNEVIAQVGGTDAGPFPHSAALVSSINPAWTASIPGASWIWWTDPTPEAEKSVNTTYTFRQTFTWMGPISGATLNLAAAADNGYEVKLNGNLIGSDSSETNYNAAGQDSYSGFSAAIVQGTNTLEIKVTNMLRPAGQTWDNPGGLLYKLTIDGNCGDAYFQNQCHLWNEKDLGPNDSFFQFNDVKPGDSGTDVISLHVYDNNAYACLIAGDKNDQENSLLAPEIAAGDSALVGNPLGLGELSNYLNVFTWGDTNGNGVYDAGETALGSGPLASLSSIMSLDSGNQQYLTATTTKNIGLAWCAGTLTPNQGNAFGCNGAGMGNIAQSDSFSASLTAYAEQVRNNGSFVCGSVNLPPQVSGSSTGSSTHAGPSAVNLLAADGFAIVAKDAITDANPAVSSVTGNIAINPTAGSAITGVSCANVLGGGKIYSSGGYTGGYTPDVTCAITDPVTALATRSAMETAYTDAAGRPTPDGFNLYAGNLGGQTLAPGLYKWTTGVTIPTDVTLAGGANDVWIFQIAGNLNIASAGDLVSGIKVKLIGGAVAKNVFWQVGGATGATLGTYATFNGTILSAKQVIIQSGAVLNGRALSQSQVTLAGNAVTKP